MAVSGVAPIAQLAEGSARMQEVLGSNPRLGGFGVSPFQVSGGIGTLQSRASGLQSTTQGITSRPKGSESNNNMFLNKTRVCLGQKTPPSQNIKNKDCRKRSYHYVYLMFIIIIISSSSSSMISSSSSMLIIMLLPHYYHCYYVYYYYCYYYYY